MNPSTEPGLHLLVVLGVLVAAALTGSFLLFVAAPYGRHLRPGWGPTVSSRVGWVIMESPAVLVFGAIYALGDARFETAPLTLALLWQLHYLHRSFVYPFRMRSAGWPMPLAVVALGLAFNTANAYIQARWVSHLGTYPDGWLTDPRFLLGALLFVGGWAINVRADSMLSRLRRPGETGYALPRGWLFERVSCPNYLGEIVEWVGWAVATWSPAGLAFAAFTVANLVPRALAHQRWYRERFPDFPAERKAVLPYLL